MATNDEVHRELFTKVGTLTNSVAELSGAVSVLNKTNTDLVALLKKALSYEFYTILILIAALVYGAIGEKGFVTIRETIPTPFSNSDDDHASVIAPWYNDQNRFLHRPSKKAA